MSKLSVDISIIIVNYNRSNYIERCLRSCIDQVIFNKNFEIIFVDDASKDDSFEVAKKFRSGGVYINGKSADAGTPFGGYRQSGNGREGGTWGIE